MLDDVPLREVDHQMTCVDQASTKIGQNMYFFNLFFFYIHDDSIYQIVNHFAALTLFFVLFYPFKLRLYIHVWQSKLKQIKKERNFQVYTFEICLKLSHEIGRWLM